MAWADGDDCVVADDISIRIRTPSGVHFCKAGEIVPRRLGLVLQKRRLILEYEVPSLELFAHHCMDVGPLASSAGDIRADDRLAAAADKLRSAHAAYLVAVPLPQLVSLLGRLQPLHAAAASTATAASPPPPPAAKSTGTGGAGSGSNATAAAAAAAVPPVVTPLSPAEASELRGLLFGEAAAKSASKALPQEWLQGWCFEPDAADACPYGLRQAEGGPCGVVASVQAFLLRRLVQRRLSPARATAAQAREALLDAMTDILFRCAEKDAQAPQVRVLAHPAHCSEVSSAARRTLRSPEGCSVLEFGAWEALRHAWEKPPLLGSYFSSDPDDSASGVGVLLYLYSAMATRGAGAVRGDADNPKEAQMIGAHGYCSQEAVNLLITGLARSNVFDGEKVLPGEKEGEEVKLRGTAERAQVGFLSLFEAFGSLEVGGMLKTPAWPVWIAHAESHYSVLFCDSVDAVAGDAKEPAEVDVWYYDPLGRQDEEKRITVTPGGLQDLPDEDDLETNGMIAKVIRTRWGQLADLDWNGAEPIY